MHKQKIYSLLIATFWLPILLCLLYAGGFHFYYGYMHAFGIPYGLFKIDFYDTLIFGGQVIAVTVIVKLLQYAVIILCIACVVILLISFISSALKMQKVVRLLEKKLNSFPFVKISREHAIFMKLCFIFSVIVFFVYLLIFCFLLIMKNVEEKGEATGIKLKNEYLEQFSKVNHKMNFSDNGLFIVNDHKNVKNLLGYVIASNEKLLALYSKDVGLKIISYSDSLEMKLYNRVT